MRDRSCSRPRPAPREIEARSERTRRAIERRSKGGDLHINVWWRHSCKHPHASILMHASSCMHPHASILMHASSCMHPHACILMHASSADQTPRGQACVRADEPHAARATGSHEWLLTWTMVAPGWTLGPLMTACRSSATFHGVMGSGKVRTLAKRSGTPAEGRETARACGLWLSGVQRAGGRDGPSMRPLAEGQGAGTVRQRAGTVWHAAGQWQGTGPRRAAPPKTIEARGRRD